MLVHHFTFECIGGLGKSSECVLECFLDLAYFEWSAANVVCYVQRVLDVQERWVLSVVLISSSLVLILKYAYIYILKIQFYHSYHNFFGKKPTNSCADLRGSIVKFASVKFKEVNQQNSKISNRLGFLWANKRLKKFRNDKVKSSKPMLIKLKYLKELNNHQNQSVRRNAPSVHNVEVFF